MKIKFIRGACGIGLAYTAGMETDCSEAFGLEMVNLGLAEIVTRSKEALPEDLPGREAFIAAGILDLEEVKKITDFTEINGIGEKTAEKIAEYLKVD